MARRQIVAKPGKGWGALSDVEAKLESPDMSVYAERQQLNLARMTDSPDPSGRGSQDALFKSGGVVLIS